MGDTQKYEIIGQSHIIFALKNVQKWKAALTYFTYLSIHSLVSLQEEIKTK